MFTRQIKQQKEMADVTTVKLADNETVLQILKTQSKAKTSSETFETWTYVANLTPNRVIWAEQKVWPGTQGLNGGGEIPTGYYATVGHRGTLPAGVKFGLVFNDSREQLPTTRKFVFAFDLPAGKVRTHTPILILDVLNSVDC